MEHVHESPWVMLVPLILLATGALVAGFALHSAFIGEQWQEFWQGSIFNGATNHTLARIETVPIWVDAVPTVVGLAGIATAYLMYMVNPLLPHRLATAFPAIYQFLLNKWYFDELYDRMIVQPLLRLARTFWQIGDVTLIDGVPNGLAELAVDGSRQAVKIQTGNVAAYAFSMLIGVVLLLSVFLLFR
jgi:NADH-quinone oxidoreductase subunit L